MDRSFIGSRLDLRSTTVLVIGEVYPGIPIVSCSRFGRLWLFMIVFGKHHVDHGLPCVVEAQGSILIQSNGHDTCCWIAAELWWQDAKCDINRSTQVITQMLRWMAEDAYYVWQCFDCRDSYRTNPYPKNGLCWLVYHFIWPLGFDSVESGYRKLRNIATSLPVAWAPRYMVSTSHFAHI